MILTRREALRQLSALFAIPLVRWPARLDDPLAGTIVEYQAGRERRDWSAAQVTERALGATSARVSAVPWDTPTAAMPNQR